MKAIPETRKAH